jgi:hypothetical protein
MAKTKTPTAPEETLKKINETDELDGNADNQTLLRGDDASFQEQQNQLGGMSGKFTGEGTENTIIGYDKNAQLTDTLGRGYFGVSAREKNEQDPNFITSRNDLLASAMYNAGMRDREQIGAWLANQEGRNDSTEEDRANTIESIWKRI